jgi:hypothetical protein
MTDTPLDLDIIAGCVVFFMADDMSNVGLEHHHLGYTNP